MPSRNQPDPSETSSSSLSLNASSNPSRPAHTFWSIGPARPPIPVPAPAKRRRRKAEDASSQAKLLAPNGAAWNIVRAENGGSTSGMSDAGSIKGKGRKDGGEEAEAMAMAKRARQGAAVAGKAALLGQEANTAASGEAATDSGSALGSSIHGGPDPLPGKRKRGRPHKLQQRLASAPLGSSSGQAPPADGHRSSDPTDAVPTKHRPVFSRPPHHFLSRTVSSPSKGASHDPVDVESINRSGPRRLVFANDHKPAHSFFSAPPEAPLEANVPVKAKADEVPTFFTSGESSAAGIQNLEHCWGWGVKEDRCRTAPWPGGDWSSHQSVAGPSKASICSLSKRERSRINPPSDSDDADYWHRLYIMAREASHDSMPQHRPKPTLQPLYKQHPAFKSLSRKSGSRHRDTWCERYRPHRAEEVLGNELEATYLRDWLTAVQLGSGRKVISKIRRSKRQSYDGWIVDDIGLFEDGYDEDDDDDGDEGKDELPEAFDEPEPPLGERPNVYSPLSSRLTNTILLAGPHGSGKSAAVYATATELGWEVFEVYPGIGRRTGANLMSLVGDVGKNHMVVKGGVRDEAEKKAAINPFFRRATEGVPRLPTTSKGSVTEPIEIEQEERNGHAGTEDRQSLILIDEVDILFAEENTFWPALVSLIAESRRPVILTCNDPEQVPRSQLPLQATLYFQPPPSHLAIPYLEAILLRERLVEATGVNDLYVRCVRHVTDVLDQALPPNGHEPIPYFDLRQAINQMQLDRNALHPMHRENSSATRDLHVVQRQLDMESFVDASVAPRSWMTREINEVDRYDVGPDDQLGIALLLKPEVDESCPILPAYNRSSDMTEDLLQIVGGSLQTQDRLQLARITHIRSLLPILDPLIPLSSYLLPHPSLFTDYMPLIRQIIAADDALEAAEEAEVSSGGNRVHRKTGRPKRTPGVMSAEGYERYLDVGRDALEAARASVLH